MSHSPIIDIINEQLKSQLEEQLAYLKSNSETRDSLTEKERFTLLRDGARTMMNILENSDIGQAGTDNFLNQLTRDQLRYAITSAQAILKEKTSIGKITLYCVDAGSAGHKWFWEKVKADAFFVEIAPKATEQRFPTLEMNPQSVPWEDVEEFIGAKEYKLAREHHKLDDVTAK